MRRRTDTRQIKVVIGDGDHDKVRLAAALRGTTMAEFFRQVVLDEAERLTRDLKLTTTKRTVSKGKTHPK